ncbi:ultra-long-chain fatty acid omega-hydroxylase-like isoform X2 [Littorina saxatilis]|uniref:ultra-long-chain fatty acid omega-hydroxylase-like isoform X2 n=1 Tax=Littorina saxatilis TaxID=31220 RepID=UPI0038B67D7C
MEDNLSLLKTTVLFSVIGYVLYRVVAAIQNFRSYAKLFNDCPGETEFHWLYGSLHKFPGPNEAGIKYDTDMMVKRPRFSRVWAGPFVPVLLLYHPDLVRILLKSSAPKPRGGFIASVYEMGLGWLGEGLLISNGARWARSRRLLTPAFHFDILKPYIHIKNQAANILLDKLQQISEEKKSFDVFQHVSLCLFDILLQCAFAHNSNCQTSGEKDKYVQNVGHLIAMWVERALKPWMHNDFLYKWMPHGRRWYKICDFVHSVSEELISKRRKVLEASQVDEKSTESKNPDKELEEPEKKCMMSFVDILLTAKDEDGKGMTPTEIRNEADTFLFEGFDTTTSALSWTLYSMARWPQHQKKVQEEVDAVLKGRSSDDILWEDLSCFPYTTACIKEAMRNFSTVPFIERETKEDVMIDGHNIPTGTFVAIQLWCLHHNPQVWDRPHDYIPERFLGDNALKMDPFQFVPFSAGPRNCIGQNFAMHELKIMVAKICHRFSLSLDPNHEVLRAPFATFKAEKDIKMFATPRLH